MVKELKRNKRVHFAANAFVLGGAFVVLALCFLFGYVSAVTALGLAALLGMLELLPKTRGQDSRNFVIRFTQNLASSAMLFIHFIGLGLAVALTEGMYKTPSFLALVILSFALFNLMVGLATSETLLTQKGQASKFFGRMVYRSLFFGHVASAIETPSKGVGLYGFARPHENENLLGYIPRIFVQSFQAGLNGENHERAGFNRGQVSVIHPFFKDFLWYGFFIAMTLVVFGLEGLTVYIALCLTTQFAVFTSLFLQQKRAPVSSDRKTLQSRYPAE